MARISPRAQRTASRRPRQIVALGGGGFTEEPDNPALDDYVLDACGRERPRVLFLPTAGGDNPSYVVKFYSAFSGGHCDAVPPGPVQPHDRRRARACCWPRT